MKRLDLLLCWMIGFFFLAQSQSKFYDEAESYAEEGNYFEAIKTERRGLKLIEQTSGKNNLQYIVSLIVLSSYASAIGQYYEAIAYSEDALQIAKKILWRQHSAYELILERLTFYYSQIYEFDEAINLEKELLSIKEKRYGKESNEYIQQLNYFANNLAENGEFAEAIKYGTEALVLRRVHFGVSSLEYINSLNNLSGYYGSLGNYDKALECALECLNIINTIAIDESFVFVKVLQNASLCYAHLHDYQMALDLGKETLKLCKQSYGENSKEYACSLNNLSGFYLGLEDYDQAIKIGLKALEIYRKTVGENSIDYASSLHNVAHFFIYQLNFKEAIKLEEEAIQIIQQILGPTHSTTILYNKSLIFYDFLLSKLNGSNWKTEINMQELNTNILSQFQSLPMEERALLWNKEEGWFNFLIPIFSYSDESSNLLPYAYNSSLFAKGILLQSELEFNKFLVETGDEALLANYNEIKSLRLQLNKLYEKPIAERYVDTDSLERQANELERQLMQESTEFGDYTRNLSITWEDVQKGLRKKDVAIEFVHFPLNQDSTMYMAYVLKPEMEAPEMVKLFEEKDVTSLYPPSKPENIYRLKGEAARELVWEKLLPYLEGCENVYFAPDGVLHQIAIEYLPYFDGEGTMADRFNMHRLSSTRQIAINNNRNNATSAAVYGGIVYDNDIASMQTESRKYKQESQETQQELLLASRGFNPFINYADILNTRDGVKFLEGTRAEAEEVNQSLKAHNYQTQLVVGKEATEESFKSLSGKNNGIIHIATHGFYWKEDEADRMARSNERLMFMSALNDNGPKYVEDKALTRSGLFMAGANNILSGDTIPEGVDDGILTAQEIAQMNLRGTDLVVLSACQTGMGEISGDGVFGLQRGFKKAGVNSLLMSLWDVDDDATQMLMTSFYQNLMSGQSKQQSLLNAQKSVREFSGDINGRHRDFSNPRYWAAFILLDALN